MHSHMLSIVTAGATLLALGTLLAAAPMAPANPGAAPAAVGLTPEQTSAAKKIVAGKCTTCHSLAKAIRKEPAQMQAHMTKKAKLSDQDLKLVVSYLTAQRNGGTNLTSKGTASTNQTATAQQRSKNRKHGADSDE